VAAFVGGSAYNMVRDIAEGFILLSPVSLKKFESGDLGILLMELEKLSREVRGLNPPQEEVLEIQKKNRKLQRIAQAQMVVQSFRMKMKR